jgi:hypothetical protein
VPVWGERGKLLDLGMEERKETVHMSAVDFLGGASGTVNLNHYSGQLKERIKTKPINSLHVSPNKFPQAIVRSVTLRLIINQHVVSVWSAGIQTVCRRRIMHSELSKLTI